MNVLLSIKPRFAKAIFDGTKKYEFRKSVFKRKDISKAYVYSSYDEMKILGFFIIDEIIADHPEELWSAFHQQAGISEEEFVRYFNGHKRGYAIKVKEATKFRHSFDPSFMPPQSFCYMERDIDG
jgi:predicted transcriptional regulator